MSQKIGRTKKISVIGVCLLIATPLLFILQSCPGAFPLKADEFKSEFHSSFSLRERINGFSDNVLTYNDAKDFFELYSESNLMTQDREYFETVMRYASDKYSNHFCMMVLGRLYEDKPDMAVFWYGKAMEGIDSLAPDARAYCQARIKKLSQK